MEINVKVLRKLTKKKFRRAFSMCILEGEKIIADNTDKILQVFNQSEIPKAILEEVKILKTYDGTFAVAKIPVPAAATVPFLVLDKIQEPGNMGAILRTAAAFGFHTVYCINCADPFSQKVLRSSSGMALKLNIIEIDYSDLPTGVAYYVANMNGENVSCCSPKNQNFGIVLGNEGQGVSCEIYKLPHTVVSIPMSTDCESLNVCVAAGILMYHFNRFFQVVKVL